MSMSASIKEPSYRTTTQTVCDHIHDHVGKTEHIADIYVKKGHPDFLEPLELFKKGQIVKKIGYVWKWCVPNSYNISVRRLTNKKYELMLEDL